MRFARAPSTTHPRMHRKCDVDGRPGCATLLTVRVGYTNYSASVRVGGRVHTSAHAAECVGRVRRTQRAGNCRCLFRVRTPIKR